mmetsp:Transcript_26410/g.30300  ORF Transcript_26410/g.30300 Transcript_26410/m.30300 type:complete len:80 (-) Transcript_26410:258-497(-)
MLTLPQWAWSMVFANKTGCFDFPAVIFIIHTKPQFRKLGGYLNKDGNPPDETVKRVTEKGREKISRAETKAQKFSGRSS